MKKINYKKYPLLMTSIITILCTFIITLNVTFAFSVGTNQNFLDEDTHVSGIVHNTYQSLNNTFNNFYVVPGETTTVQTKFIVRLAADDAYGLFAIHQANATNTIVELNELTDYVTGTKLTRENLVADNIPNSSAAYNYLSSKVDTESSLYYFLTSQQIEELLDGKSSKMFVIDVQNTHTPIEEHDFGTHHNFAVAYHVDNRSGFVSNNYAFNKATFDATISQDIPIGTYDIGDIIPVSLAIENTSNAYLEDVAVDIFNSKEEDAYLSNISNFNVTLDQDIRITREKDSATISWHDEPITSSQQPAHIEIGTWQGSEEYRNVAEDNTIYITFDYIVSDEDLQNGELTIRSVLSATSPKHGYKASATDPVSSTNETNYYYTEDALSKIVSIQEEEAAVLTIDNTTLTPEPEIPNIEVPPTKGSDTKKDTSLIQTNDSQNIKVFSLGVCISMVGIFVFKHKK